MAQDLKSLEFNTYRIDPTIELTAPPVVISIDGLPVLTEGEISTLTGKAKSKKTFCATSFAAAALAGKIENMANVAGHITGHFVLWFDTEQSPYYAARAIRGICKQAGSNDQPKLQAFGLRSMETTPEMVAFIEGAINEYKPKFVVIDGIKDLLSKGINDEEEAIKIVRWLMKLSTKHECHILGVLHQNKGNEHVRGHIGTEMINKSGAVISVDKSTPNDPRSIVSPKFMRDKNFQEYAFVINEENVPELSDPINTAEIKRQSDQAKKQEALKLIFKATDKISYTDLYKAYAQSLGIADRTAKRHIADAIKDGLLLTETGSGVYTVADFIKQPF